MWIEHYNPENKKVIVNLKLNDTIVLNKNKIYFYNGSANNFALFIYETEKEAETAYHTIGAMLNPTKI